MMTMTLENSLLAMTLQRMGTMISAKETVSSRNQDQAGQCPRHHLRLHPYLQEGQGLSQWARPQKLCPQVFRAMK